MAGFGFLWKHLVFCENSWRDSMGNSVVLTEKPEIHKHTRLIEYSSRFLTHKL